MAVIIIQAQTELSNGSDCRIYKKEQQTCFRLLLLDAICFVFYAGTQAPGGEHTVIVLQG